MFKILSHSSSSSSYGATEWLRRAPAFNGAEFWCRGASTTDGAAKCARWGPAFDGAANFTRWIARITGPSFDARKSTRWSKTFVRGAHHATRCPSRRGTHDDSRSTETSYAAGRSAWRTTGQYGQAAHGRSWTEHASRWSPRRTTGHATRRAPFVARWAATSHVSIFAAEGASYVSARRATATDVPEWSTWRSTRGPSSNITEQ